MMTIETERLILRPITLSDLDTTHEYAGDARHAQYMLFLPNDTIQATEQFLQNAVSEWEKAAPQFYEFAITLAGKHIGAVSIYREPDSEACELGWIINKNYQGNGYVTEAAKAAMNFSVNMLKASRIVAHCDHRNAASYRVMQKIGLTLESDSGTRRYKGTDEDVQEFMCSIVV